MKMPWHNRTGLAKATAILIVIFSVSSGLCGLNALAWFTISGHPEMVRVSNLLPLTGAVELVVMAISLVCVLIVIIADFIETMRRRLKSKDPRDDS